MALQLRDRLRPWHAVMLVVLLAGIAVSLSQSNELTGGAVLQAVLSGLLGLVLFQFTVGNVWGYAVEYHNTGGSWTDWPFLFPFVSAAVGGAAVGVWFGSAALGAWVAFWVFVVVAGVVAVGSWLVVGYRETGA